MTCKTQYIIKKFNPKRNTKHVWLQGINISKFGSKCLMCKRDINKFRPFYGLSYKYTWVDGFSIMAAMLGLKRNLPFYNVVCSEQCAMFLILDEMNDE
jgi:hypothetical protein